MLKVCLLGHGGIGQSHRRAYAQLAEQNAPIQLVGICDIDPGKFTGDMAINLAGVEGQGVGGYRCYTDLEEMLTKEQPDVIDICLPTYLHCRYTVMLLKRGYHVQCEKPMALNPDECGQMLAAAKESGKQLMIGMCLRFDPLYLELKKMIDEETYGKVYEAHFERLSGLPGWGFEGWFRDYARSGGVALDMHIHDVDMIRFLFGEPTAVSAVTGNNRAYCSMISSRFEYGDKQIFAVGDWAQSSSFPFKMAYRVNFERASVIMDGGRIRVCPEGEAAFDLVLEEKNRMAEEIAFFARVILGEEANTKNTPADAAQSAAMIAKLMESAGNGGRPVVL